MKSFSENGFGATLVGALKSIKQTKPLVHCMTNYVSMDIVANVLLAASCSPAMIHAVEEAPKFSAFCAENVANGAVYINVGTVSPPWAEAMKASAAECDRLSIPWILDPVGVGAPPLQFRTDLCVELCKYNPTVIRANPAECIALAKAVLSKDTKKELETTTTSSKSVAQSGVDSLTDSMDVDLRYVDALAEAISGVVCMTGSADYISCGSTGKAFIVKHNVPELQYVTAAGCSLSALIGGFLARTDKAADGNKDYALATAHAAAYYSLAAQEGVKKLKIDNELPGPGTIRVALIDMLFKISPEQVASLAKIEKIR
eukprot:CFRG3193T1